MNTSNLLRLSPLPCTLLILSGLTTHAAAEIVEYDFRVENLTGELSGQQFLGSFSFDDENLGAISSIGEFADSFVFEVDFRDVGAEFGRVLPDEIAFFSPLLSFDFDFVNGLNPGITIQDIDFLIANPSPLNQVPAYGNVLLDKNKNVVDIVYSVGYDALEDALKEEFGLGELIDVVMGEDGELVEVFRTITNEFGEFREFSDFGPFYTFWNANARFGGADGRVLPFRGFAYFSDEYRTSEIFYDSFEEAVQAGELVGVGDVIIERDGIVVAQSINPVFPNLRDDNGVWLFEDVPSGFWFDPITTYGFNYLMTGGSLFTDILGLPIGLDADELFTVSVGDVVLGEFQSIDQVKFGDYADILGNLLLTGTDGKLGVSSFSVAGIDSPVDPDDPLAFPIQLAFDTQRASFSMAAFERSDEMKGNDQKDVPEPSTLLGLLGLSALMGYWKHGRTRIS